MRLHALPRLLACLLAAAPAAFAADMAALFAERSACTVAVEFIVEAEIGRIPQTHSGTIVNDAGVILLNESAVTDRVQPSQLKDFKVYPAGSETSLPARYLGQDPLSGWHFIQLEGGLPAGLVPVTRFAADPPPPLTPGAELWGVGLRDKDESFIPYLMSGRLAYAIPTPWLTGVSVHDLAAPGLPVFDGEGRFAGIACDPYANRMVLYSPRDRGTPVALINIGESGVFIAAGACLEFFSRIPDNPVGRPIAWTGLLNLEPVPREVAEFLSLPEGGALVVSEVFPGGPAAAAGIQERDIILAVDGVPLPALKPRAGIPDAFGAIVHHHKPGDTITLKIQRGGSLLGIAMTLAEEPKRLREAERHYFEKSGFTIREFLPIDALIQRIKPGGETGVIAHFIKPNGPAAAAGLQPDDWICEIGGQAAATYAEAVERINQLEAAGGGDEYVLMVRRGSETQILRIRLR